ncbi:MAG: PAS domain-containing hybrid sensor histidine kinase/response regulator [Phycisphaerales bacterium]
MRTKVHIFWRENTGFIGQPLTQAALAAVVLFGAALIAMFGVRSEARRAVTVECQDNLLRLANLAGSIVDTELHERLLTPESEKTEEYRQAIQPLRRMLGSDRSIKYIYTGRARADGTLEYVLDPTPDADDNKDGVNDRVPPATPWQAPHPQVLEVLRTGLPGVSETPYSDMYGTFMSAFVPLNNAAGKTIGVLGVDITADSYNRRLARISDAAAWGLLPCGLVSLLIGWATFRVRRTEVIAAAAVRDSESRFKLMADAAPVMIWVADESQRLTYFNRGWLEYRGATAEHEASSGFGQGVHPDDFERYLGTFMSAWDAGRSFEMEYRLRRADGQYRWVLERGCPRLDQRGSLLGYIGGCVDIHEHRRVRDQLAAARLRAESADRAKSEFVANMSHELRSPLTAILGYVDVLEESQLGTDAARRSEAINTIRRNGDHLIQVINDLLDLSKIEAGRMAVDSIAASPAEVVRDVVSILHAKAWDKCIALNITLDSDLPDAVTTDPTRLRQILLNLVSNAIRWSRQGTVTVAASALPDSFLKFTVTDSGATIPPEQVERLFRPFSQAEASSPRCQGTAGLGLCISRSLAQAMGGDIFVSSDPATGTVFTLMVKAERTDPSGCISAADAAAAAGANLSGARILLADDSEDNRRLLTFILTRQGAAVETVDSGDAAINIAPGGGFDLVLMDTHMPGTDGYAAATQLRALGYDRPIIALTASAFAAERDKCVAAGCDDFAAKPIDKQRLISLCALWRTRPSDRRKAA